MTFDSLVELVIPGLFLAAIFGGWRISTKINIIADHMESGFDSLHSDIQDLKDKAKIYEDRIRGIEISQARHEARDEAEHK